MKKKIKQKELDYLTKNFYTNIWIRIITTKLKNYIR